MRRRPPRTTRTDTPLPYTTLSRSVLGQSKTGEIVKYENGHRMPQIRGRLALRQQHVLAVEFGKGQAVALQIACGRSEEHTSELQSLMRISYAVFCLKKKTTKK